MTVARADGDSRQWLGRQGEAAAEEALVRAGLRILERRFRSRFGEVDLVALDGDVMVFVEVKTRRGLRFGSPAEAVIPRKQARLARAALAYLSRHGMLDRCSRFDVVEVLAEAGGRMVVRHIPDAFRC